MIEMVRGWQSLITATEIMDFTLDPGPLMGNAQEIGSDLARVGRRVQLFHDAFYQTIHLVLLRLYSAQVLLEQRKTPTQCMKIAIEDVVLSDRRHSPWLSPGKGMDGHAKFPERAHDFMGDDQRVNGQQDEQEKKDRPDMAVKKEDLPRNMAFLDPSVSGDLELMEKRHKERGGNESRNDQEMDGVVTKKPVLYLSVHKDGSAPEKCSYTHLPDLPGEYWTKQSRSTAFPGAAEVPVAIREWTDL